MVASFNLSILLLCFIVFLSFACVLSRLSCVKQCGSPSTSVEGAHSRCPTACEMWNPGGGGGCSFAHGRRVAVSARRLRAGGLMTFVSQRSLSFITDHRVE